MEKSLNSQITVTYECSTTFPNQFITYCHRSNWRKLGWKEQVLQNLYDTLKHRENDVADLTKGCTPNSHKANRSHYHFNSSQHPGVILCQRNFNSKKIQLVKGDQGIGRQFVLGWRPNANISGSSAKDETGPPAFPYKNPQCGYKTNTV